MIYVIHEDYIATHLQVLTIIRISVVIGGFSFKQFYLYKYNNLFLECYPFFFLLFFSILFLQLYGWIVSDNLNIMDFATWTIAYNHAQTSQLLECCTFLLWKLYFKLFNFLSGIRNNITWELSRESFDEKEAWGVKELDGESSSTSMWPCNCHCLVEVRGLHKPCCWLHIELHILYSLHLSGCMHVNVAWRDCYLSICQRWTMMPNYPPYLSLSSLPFSVSLSHLLLFSPSPHFSLLSLKLCQTNKTYTF